MNRLILQFIAMTATARHAWAGFSPARRTGVLSGLAGLLLLSAAIAPQTTATPLSPDFFVSIAENPTHLSETDATLYKAGFAALAQRDYTTLADMLTQVRNKRLVGYLLARQYLSGSYTATAEELTAWLEKYSDHIQARDIQRLAVARGVKTPPIPAEKPLKGEGYAEHLGRSTMPDSWFRALSLWREQNYSDALPLFESIGENKTLSGWQRAAGSYWASRAATELGHTRTARSHLRDAAEFKTTFYGILAAEKAGLPSVDGRAPRVTHHVRNHPQAIRAALFAQLDHTDEAENELRYLYSAVSETERPGIVTLAHELNLANLQVRLANLSHLTPEEELFASYPMPQYVIDAQAQQSPALLLAIARNETGFRETASSSAGAVGLMQMLPSTAHAIERHVGREVLEVASSGDIMPLVERLNDPATSVRYSAQYLSILAKEPAVKNDLIRVLAAYNAGPGNVSNWQTMARQINDPLLYIESIPYPETRNYVMQVMAHSWVYGNLLGEHSASLRGLAQGQWPQLN